MTRKRQTSMGEKEGKVMNTRGKNGQKLEKKNEKPVNGKNGNAGNGTSRHKDVEEESDIKDAERSIWHEEYITVRDERKQMGRRRQRKGQKSEKETLDKTSPIENHNLNCHFNTPFFFSLRQCVVCHCYQI